MSPLILGGHSFIAQLGNDPKLTESQIDALVSACLDSGLSHFDTTYRPERVALGASLARLGRRDEARIIVWNFFENFGDGQPTGGVNPYRPAHLQEILRDLQTDHLDELVVHRVGDVIEDETQQQLALDWKNAGHVQRLGIWSPGIASDVAAQRENYDFVVEPHNLFTQGAVEKLAAYARNGWEIYACSPFVRGWQMDNLVAVATGELGLDEATARQRVADYLLRYALFAPHIERLIVAMRRPEWVQQNLASVGRGPLNLVELDWLEGLKHRLPRTGS